MSANLLDQALVLFGRPKRIWADIRTQRAGASDDFFEIIADYGNFRVSLKGSYLPDEQGRRFLVRGTKGVFTKRGRDNQASELKKGGRPGTKCWGEEPKELWGQLTSQDKTVSVETIPGDYTRFYSDVARAINGRRVPLATAFQARDTLRFLELAHQSQAEGRWIEWNQNKVLQLQDSDSELLSA